MPELPEVQTIVDDLNKKIKGLTITDVWTDWPKYFKRSKGGFDGFRKTVKNKKINKMLVRTTKILTNSPSELKTPPTHA